MFELTGKTAVVTGGSRGIGRAICQKLAAQGANIVLNYAGNEAAAQETERLCRELGAEVLTLRGDVSDPDACTRLVEQTLERFGAIDILVCNAGITRDNLLMRMSDAEFDQVIATNLKGTFNCMRAAVRPMMRKRRGRIISISSVVGVMGKRRTDQLCRQQGRGHRHDQVACPGGSQPGDHRQCGGAGLYPHRYDRGAQRWCQGGDPPFPFLWESWAVPRMWPILCCFSLRTRRPISPARSSAWMAEWPCSGRIKEQTE